MSKYGEYQLEGLKYQRVYVRNSEREKKAFKRCIGKEEATAWAHFERKESCERSN